MEIAPQPYRPTYREARGAVESHADKLVKRAAGDKGDFAKVFTGFFLLTPAEAAAMTPEQRDGLHKVMKYVAKRLTWSSVNAPVHRYLEIDTEKDLTGELSKFTESFGFSHDVIHALIALSFHRGDNSMTPEFYRLASEEEVTFSPQVLEEELMVSFFTSDAFRARHENFFTAIVRKGNPDIEATRKFARPLGVSGPFHPIFEKGWEAFYENKEEKWKEDEFLYFLEAFEIFWLNNFKAGNLIRLRLTEDERHAAKRQALFSGLEKSFKLLQENRSPQYLTLARNIYEACRADPDRKDPTILWREFERLAEPILKKNRRTQAQGAVEGQEN